MISVGRGGSGHCCFPCCFCFSLCDSCLNAAPRPVYMNVSIKIFPYFSDFFHLFISTMVSCAHTLSHTTRSSIAAHRPLDIGSDVLPSPRPSRIRSLVASWRRIRILAPSLPIPVRPRLPQIRSRSVAASRRIPHPPSCCYQNRYPTPD